MFFTQTESALPLMLDPPVRVERGGRNNRFRNTYCFFTLRGPTRPHLIYGRAEEDLRTVDDSGSEQLLTCCNNNFFDKNFSRKKN